MNYVYLYRINDVPIYVGIGTEDDGKFKRAYNLKAHPSLAKSEHSKIRVDVVMRNASRSEALKTEAALIQALGVTNRLRNVVVKYKDVGAPIIIQDPETEDDKVRRILTERREEIKAESFAVYSCLGGSGVADHILYFESDVSKSSKKLLKGLIPDHNPHVASILTKTEDWFVRTKPSMFERVLVLVLNEKHSRALNALWKTDYLSFGSLESYVRYAVLTAEGRAQVRDFLHEQVNNRKGVAHE